MKLTDDILKLITEAYDHGYRVGRLRAKQLQAIPQKERANCDWEAAAINGDRLVVLRTAHGTENVVDSRGPEVTTQPLNGPVFVANNTSVILMIPTEEM